METSRKMVWLRRLTGAGWWIAVNLLGWTLLMTQASGGVPSNG